MAENSKNSAQSGSPSTRKTVKLTVEQALQILEDSLLIYQKSGGRYAVTTYHDHGEKCVVAFIYGATIQDGHLVPLMAQDEKTSVINGTEESAQSK